MSLHRGFKTEANAYAREFRQELGLSMRAPLCPWKLASHLDIPVIALSSLKSTIPIEIAFLLRHGGDYFSAATIGSGFRRAILHNDANAKTRQASDVSHEIAHAVLGHPVVLPFDELGKRTFNKDHEDEASWLGAALLISEEAALWVVRSGQSIEVAAGIYSVSPSLLKMRLNVTGARRRVGGQRS